MGSRHGIPDFAAEARRGYPATEEPQELQSLRAELLDLFQLGLVKVPRRSQRVRKEKPAEPTLTSSSRGARIRPMTRYEYETQELPWPAIPDEVNARSIELSKVGALLARLMRLSDVPQDDRDRLVVSHLRVHRN